MDKILGATAVGGEMRFCVRFKDQDSPSMITSEEAKEKYPYHLLDFYESFLVWESEEENVDDDDGSNDAAAAGSSGAKGSDGGDKPLTQLRSNQ